MVNVNKAQLGLLLFDSTSNWAILTADKDNNSYDQQTLARLALQSVLDYRGYEYLLVDGYCKMVPEQAVLILDITASDAASLASLFNQEAFLCTSGLLYQNAGRTGYVLAPYVNRMLMDVAIEQRDRCVVHCSDGDVCWIVEV